QIRDDVTPSRIRYVSPSSAWAPLPPRPDRAAAAASAASSLQSLFFFSLHQQPHLASPLLAANERGRGRARTTATASGSRWLPCFPSSPPPSPRQPAKSSQQVVAGSEQEESSLAFLSPRNFDSFWEGIWCAAAAPDASHQQEQAPAEACQILL
uniref:Uncharacterized protein n=1 Tax=Oryza rufipogon TaxID=4529 RepID=A0A0E0Q3U6_ORYRU